MSKGGSTTTSVEVPEYIEEAAKRNLNRAEGIANLGYVPYYGPDVAALTPLQEAAFGNVGGQAGAFGLATPAGGAMAGMPAAQEFAGGVRGYSSAPMFEQAQAELAARRPAQKSYIDSFFIDPFTGEYGSNVAAPIDYTTAFPQAPVAPTTPSAPAAPASPVNTGVGGITDVQDVIDAYGTLPPEVLPPVVPAAGGTAPVVGDIVDNTALQGAQNQVVVDAFNQYGDVLSDQSLTPVQVAAANPAFNPEIAIANQDVQVTIDTPTGSYTKPAGDLTSQDFAAATGATYTPAETAGGLGTFTGGGTGINTSDLTGQTLPYSDVADLAEQYELSGKSAAAAGIRNIGGAYAQSPAGSGELVETQYDPATGKSTIIGVEATPKAYDGSSEKNAAVAKILKEQYGWSDSKLASQGYEGYGLPEEKTIFETVTDPIVDLITPEPSDFQTTFEAASADAASDPTGSYMPTKSQQDFASTVLASDDISSFLPPTPTETTPASTSSKIGTDAGDGMVWAKSSTSNALVRVPKPRSSSGSSGGGGGGSSSGSGDGCVIATHAVASGGFTPSMKREAVVWCMNVLHDKWWGEAIRRGYRYLGSKKIEQGKAHEHYAEFREYIAFANGKKRTLKGALTFAYRTAQFFAVGLVKKDA